MYEQKVLLGMVLGKDYVGYHESHVYKYEVHEFVHSSFTWLVSWTYILIQEDCSVFERSPEIFVQKCVVYFNINQCYNNFKIKKIGAALLGKDFLFHGFYKKIDF